MSHFSSNKKNQQSWLQIKKSISNVRQSKLRNACALFANPNIPEHQKIALLNNINYNPYLFSNTTNLCLPSHNKKILQNDQLDQLSNSPVDTTSGERICGYIYGEFNEELSNESYELSNELQNESYESDNESHNSHDSYKSNESNDSMSELTVGSMINSSNDQTNDQTNEEELAESIVKYTNVDRMTNQYNFNLEDTIFFDGLARGVTVDPTISLINEQPLKQSFKQSFNELSHELANESFNESFNDSPRKITLTIVNETQKTVTNICIHIKLLKNSISDVIFANFSNKIVNKPTHIIKHVPNISIVCIGQMQYDKFCTTKNYKKNKNYALFVKNKNLSNIEII